jgi:uncharacterized protein (TIGR02266 family)
MTEDRRSVPRAVVPGVHVTYESADGEPRQADVTNLGTGGLFLCTDAPIAVGKRMSLDLYVTGENAPWTALGRIVWSRSADEGPGRPAGMGVKLIDVDDVVLASIERLVASREATEPGVGQGPTPPIQPPPRERTMLGVGDPVAGGPAAIEIRRVPVPGAHSRVLYAREEVEPQLTWEESEDVDPGAEPPSSATEVTPEASLAIELVAKKPDSVRVPASRPAAAGGPAGAPAGTGAGTAVDPRARAAADAAGAPPEPRARAASIPSARPAAGTAHTAAAVTGTTADATVRLPRRRKRRTGTWLFAIVLVVSAASGAAYVYRDQLPSLWQRVRGAVGPPLDHVHHSNPN